MYAELAQKVCVVCGESKKLEFFYKDKRRSQGVARECKDCKKRETKLSRVRNPERWKLKRRRNLLKEKYNITPAQYDSMFEVQKGKCAICEVHQNNLKKALFVDHDHSTGLVRSLLCQKCNFAIGLLDESSNLLNSAIAYLNKHKK